MRLYAAVTFPVFSLTLSLTQAWSQKHTPPQPPAVLKLREQSSDSLLLQSTCCCWVDDNSRPSSNNCSGNSSTSAVMVRNSNSQSRRGFLATVTAGAGLTGHSLLTHAATAADNNSNLLLSNNSNPLTGKVMVITGASSGLGLESAKELAKAGATVVLTARTEEKGQAAVAAVKEYVMAAQQQRSSSNKNDVNNVYSVALDLDDLQNVRGFPKRLQETLGAGNTQIDVLINNAGVMAIPNRQETKDGFERTFQSNHLGHFVLTAKLLPMLSKENARVINVSSLAYSFASNTGLDLENLNGERDYGPWKSYGLSKLENILFTQELQRRSDAAGRSLTVVCLHPGMVNTDLARNFVGEEQWNEKKAGRGNAAGSSFWEKAIDEVISKVLLTPEKGAATQVFLASTPTLSSRAKDRGGGAFYNNLKPEKLPSYATDEDMARELWERSEAMGGITFEL